MAADLNIVRLCECVIKNPGVDAKKKKKKLIEAIAPLSNVTKLYQEESCSFFCFVLNLKIQWL